MFSKYNVFLIRLQTVTVDTITSFIVSFSQNRNSILRIESNYSNRKVEKIDLHGKFLFALVYPDKFFLSKNMIFHDDKQLFLSRTLVEI